MGRQGRKKRGNRLEKQLRGREMIESDSSAARAGRDCYQIMAQATFGTTNTCRPFLRSVADSSTEMK